MCSADNPDHRARSAALRFFRTGLLVCLTFTFMVVARAANESSGGLTERPFAPRSGPRGATMFKELPPTQTAVITENKYDDPRMWGERYQEFALGSIGTGVAVGDYDNDGRPDLLVMSKTEPFRLFRNLGNWKFEDVTEKAGLSAASGVWAQGLASVKRWVGKDGSETSADEPWKQGATFADVNNDGWLDLYICRYNAPNLLYINQHDGTFKEEAAARGLAVVDATGMAAFCDYDRDGWLDVFIQTNMLNASAHPNGQPDYLFHNNRDGTFTNVTTQAGIKGDTLAHSGTWWDYDNDGWPDLYVAKDFGPLDSLYHNNRDGTFTDVVNQVAPHTAFSAMGADLGDVNNDGLIDFFVADMAATTHENDQRGMASSRSLSTEGADGAPIPQYPRNVLFLNTGTGSFIEAAGLAGLAATDWTWSVRFEDLDNDGRLDLHVTNGMNREYQNTDLRDRIILAENPAERMRIMRTSRVLAESNLAFRNLGDLQFENVSASWGLDQKGVSFGAAFGDFDGDGDLDLVYCNYQKGVTLLRNDSDTGHRIVVALRGTQSNRFGVGATVRIETAAGVQVRQLVLSRGYLSNSEPILHFGLGEDTLIKRLTVAWPSGQTQSFTDLTADRSLTITEPSSPPAHPKPPTSSSNGQFTEVSKATNLSFASREANIGVTNQQPLLTMRQNRRGPGAAVGDVNGDGKEDLIIGASGIDPAHLLLANATTGFTNADPALPATGAGVDEGPLLLFDADGDGHNDLLRTKSGANLPAGSPRYQPTLWLNDGHGAFRPAPDGALPALPMSVGAAAAADFDRDGHVDLFLGARVLPGQYPLSPRSALLANRGGKFEDVTDSLAPGLREIGLVSSALWTDVDGDGWLDLLVSLEWGGVRYWHNNSGHDFEDRSDAAGFSAAGTGWWNSLAAADFNGDGRMDYVAGNLGLNTQYHATAEHPALLFLGDFGSGGPAQLVEAYYEGDRLFPWRTRKDLSAKIPSVLKRYSKNDDYARATLEEIIGKDRLAAAHRFAATELRSGVFLSQPNGTYQFEVLPRLAQVSLLQGIVAGDFDGDGKADIYVVQNSYAPMPVVGRFDGGISQLLRGDGHGHFSVIPALESGLVVPGDAKALVVLDLDRDGWPDFLVTRNNNTNLVYRNNGVAGRHELRVSLRGPAGNPTAIGARVTLALNDGLIQLSEVAAGSGYYSQSSAACFFGYPDSNPPHHLSVRWPSGKTSEHDVPPKSTELTLSAP